MHAKVIVSGATVDCEIIPIRHPVDDVQSVFTGCGSRMAYDILKGHYQGVQTTCSSFQGEIALLRPPAVLHVDMTKRIAERVRKLEIRG